MANNNDAQRQARWATSKQRNAAKKLSRNKQPTRSRREIALNLRRQTSASWRRHRNGNVNMAWVTATRSGDEYNGVARWRWARHVFIAFSAGAKMVGLGRRQQ